MKKTITRNSFILAGMMACLLTAFSAKALDVPDNLPAPPQSHGGHLPPPPGWPGYDDDAGEPYCLIPLHRLPPPPGYQYPCPRPNGDVDEDLPPPPGYPGKPDPTEPGPPPGYPGVPRA